MKEIASSLNLLDGILSNYTANSAVEVMQDEISSVARAFKKPGC